MGNLTIEGLRAELRSAKARELQLKLEHRRAAVVPGSAWADAVTAQLEAQSSLAFLDAKRVSRRRRWPVGKGWIRKRAERAAWRALVRARDKALPQHEELISRLQVHRSRHAKGAR